MFNLDRYAHGAWSFTRKPAWHEANYNDFKRYQQKLNKTSIILLYKRARCCRNPSFAYVNHLAMLNSDTGLVNEACIDAAYYTFPFTGSSHDRSSKRVSG